MVLVAPGVCRFTINGVYLNRPALNVLDMVINDQVGPDDRDDSIHFVAGQMIDAWADNVMTRFGTAYSFREVSWVDLNTADGSVGSRNSTATNNLPKSATGSGQPLSAALAMLVTKVTTRQRGGRPGRWFLPGFTEGDIEGNIWLETTLTATNAALSEFLEEMTETAIINDHEFFPTVVHTRNAGTPQNPNIVYVNNTKITDLNASGRVSTQRRRNRP